MINCVISTADGVVCHSALPPTPRPPLDKGLNLRAAGSAGGPWLSTDVWKWPSVEENHLAQVRILAARWLASGGGAHVKIKGRPTRLGRPSSEHRWGLLKPLLQPCSFFLCLLLPPTAPAVVALQDFVSKSPSQSLLLHKRDLGQSF